MLLTPCPVVIITHVKRHLHSLSLCCYTTQAALILNWTCHTSRYCRDKSQRPSARELLETPFVNTWHHHDFFSSSVTLSFLQCVCVCINVLCVLLIVLHCFHRRVWHSLLCSLIVWMCWYVYVHINGFVPSSPFDTVTGTVFTACVC